MQDLATQAWDPFVAWLVLGVGGVVLLATLAIPLRGLPRAITALRGGQVTEQAGRGPLWLALAAATGMGGITGSVLAIGTAGPGALVWMWIATLLGMGLVFAEGSLGARATDDTEPASVHLLQAPYIGKLIAPMYALAVVAMALVVGAAFQTHQAAAVVEMTLGVPTRWVAIGVAIAAAPFVLLPRLSRPLFFVVPVAMLVYVVVAVSSLGGEVPLGLLLGDAVNQAFGLAPAAGGVAGGGVGLLVAHGVLRATMTGEAGLGTAALLDLRARSRGTAGAVAMLIPLLASGVIGSVSGLLMLGAAGDGAVAEAKLSPLERSYARGLRPSQQVGQTIVLPADTTMESGGHYEMELRSNPRGHALAKLVVPEQNEALPEEERNKKPHVVVPHWGIAQNANTVVFRARDTERAKHSSWDVRIPCEREVKPLPSGNGREYLLLRPTDPELDMRRLAVQLDLLTQPHVVFDDFDFVGRVGRATSPDSSLGEHLAMYEAPAEDRPFNPQLHEFFRMGYRGPYAADEAPRPPWGFIANEDFLPEIGTVVDLRIEGNPRGDDVLGITRSGTIEAPPWDLLLEARTVVLQHETDTALDIRIPVTAKYDNYRVRFDISDERFADMRKVKKMEGYSGPFLVVPDYDFKAEVRGDARLPDDMKGRRVLVPLHELGEPQGPYGETQLYTPHPGELVDFGMAAPALVHEGAQILAARVTRENGGFGRFAIVFTVLVFALTTVVGWAELGGRAATAIAGSLGGPALRLAMLAFAALGTSFTLAELLPVVDLTIAAVAVPSLLGLVLLLPKIRQAARFEDDLATNDDA